MSKSLGLAASLALVIFAAVGVTSATAAYHIESCMEKAEECKTATVGTTFKATSESFVLNTEEKAKEEKEEEPKKIECKKVTLEGKVTDSTTEKAEDPMSLSITSATFAECGGTTVTAEKLPWTISADQPTYESTGRMEYSGYLIVTGFGCRYTMMAPNDLVFRVYDPVPRRWLDVGNLKYEAGPFYCWNLRSVMSTSVINSVSDPNLTGATSLRIQ